MKINMALTKVQEHLIDGLKIFGVHRDQAVAMMVFMKDDEPGMCELMEFMAINQPTAHEIIKKSIEIIKRGRPPMDYSNIPEE